MDISVIIAAAGKGERAKLNKNKLLVPFMGKTVLDRTVEAFIKSGLIKHYIITASKKDFEEISSSFPFAKIVLGGKTRTESIKNALKEVKDGIVLIHDGARPFVSTEIIKNCIDGVKLNKSAITVVPSSDTVAISCGEEIKDYLGKDKLLSIQTPQGFYACDIKKAYENLKGTYNDDGEVYKSYFNKVYTVLGDKNNIKLTYPEDFERLNTYSTYRFGTGFDCHKLVENRKLILGGIEIPHNKGLLGHSDADVLTHAIMDAILSACAMRDIGYHFPDTDKKYKDANSIKLLKEVLKIIGKEGYKVKSVSATIMAEKPKLLKHIPEITENLSKTLKIPLSEIGIGATTLEGLGFIGREEGICVSSTAVVIKE